MKIIELLEESKLDEIGSTPMGIGARIGQKLASYIPGQIGAKASAKLDVGKRANELSKTFSQWALRSGIQLNNVPVGSIKQFLKQQQLAQPQFSQTAYDLTNKDQNTKVWTAVSQAAFRSSSATQQGTIPLGQTYGVSAQSVNRSSINNLINALGSMNLTPAQKSRLQNIIGSTPE